MGYSIRPESVVKMKDWLEILEANREPILHIATTDPQKLSYLLNQAVASASQLKFPKYSTLRQKYRFKVVGDELVCYFKDVVAIETLIYINNPDPTDLFELMDAYASHTSPLPLRLPNIPQDEEILNWLSGKKHEWKDGKLFLYREETNDTETILPESP